MLRRQLEAISVFAVERLQGFGFSLDRACEFVADKLVKAGIKGTRSKSPISGRTVRNWKQRMAEDVKDASYVNKAAAAMRTIGLEMDADGLDTPADILELVEMMAEAYASGDFT